MITQQFLMNFGLKVLIMFALMLVTLSANKVGLLQQLTRPMDKIKNAKYIYLLWFFFGFFMTAFIPDTHIATVLLPIALVYAHNRGLNKLPFLLTVVIGITAGNDLTYFGGGDNIVAWSLLENHLGEQFGILVWARLFWIPTILASMIAAGYMWFRVFEDKELYPAEYLVVEKSYQFIAVLALFLVTIIFALSKNMELYALGAALISAFIAALTMTEIRKLPFKAIYIWGASLLIGTFLSGYIKENFTLIMPSDNSLVIASVITITFGFLTNFMTNGGLTSLGLPLVFNVENVDTIWLFALSVKAIGLSYLTILANGAYAVAAGYGMSQKDLIKVGVPIMIMQMIFFIVYFVVFKAFINIG